MSRAKRIFIIFSVLIVAIGGGLLWHSHTVNKAQNKEFNPIAEPMIRDLVSSNWSAKVVYKYASPRLKKRMDKNQIVMEGPRAMPSWTGNVKEYEGVRRVYIDMRYNIASVTSKVYFDYNNIFTYPPCGASYVTLLLCKNDDGKWSLDGFAIDSPISQQLIYVRFCGRSTLTSDRRNFSRFAVVYREQFAQTRMPASLAP
jgi:hypothetical protein